MPFCVVKYRDVILNVTCHSERQPVILNGKKKQKCHSERERSGSEESHSVVCGNLFL